MRALRRCSISAALPEHGRSWRQADEGRASCTWWRPPDAHDQGPIALRYPGRGGGRRHARARSAPEIGRGRVMKAGLARPRSSRSAPASPRRAKAAEELAPGGSHHGPRDARFAKPLDLDLLGRLAGEHEVVSRSRKSRIGGFRLLRAATAAGGRRPPSTMGLKVRAMVLPDSSTTSGQPAKMYPRRPASTPNAIRRPRCFDALGGRRAAERVRVSDPGLKRPADRQRRGEPDLRRSAWSGIRGGFRSLCAVAARRSASPEPSRCRSPPRARAGSPSRRLPPPARAIAAWRRCTRASEGDPIHRSQCARPHDRPLI